MGVESWPGVKFCGQPVIVNQFFWKKKERNFQKKVNNYLCSLLTEFSAMNNYFLYIYFKAIYC